MSARARTHTKTEPTKRHDETQLEWKIMASSFAFKNFIGGETFIFLISYAILIALITIHKYARISFAKSARLKLFRRHGHYISASKCRPKKNETKRHKTTQEKR